MIDIYLDRDACIGCGMCEAMMPESFALDDDGIVTFIGEDEPDEDALAETIESCPVKAIS